MRVLVIEDDARIVSFLDKGLTAEGHTVTCATKATEAEAALEHYGEGLDLVLLDLGLPAGDGEDILRRLRRRGSTVPVIVLTARAEVADRVRGLDAGANDYLTKPFAFEELLARMRAVRRTVEAPGSNELIVGDLRLDTSTKVAWRAGRRIDLSPREWALLELFMRAPTRLFTRAHILNKVWQYDLDPGTNVVDVYVGYLRKKLNHPGLDPLIDTVRGAGYRLIKP
jgi:two-component system OmpR family response regulator